MKSKFLIVVCCMFGLAACSDPKPAAPQTSEPPPEPPSTEFVETKPVEVAPTPEPEPEPAAPEPPPPPAKPTEGSIVWALTRISVVNDDGIFAVNPGTKLRVLALIPNGYHVTDEKREFDVNENQVGLVPAGVSTTANPAWTREQIEAARLARERAGQQAVSAQKNQLIGELQNRYDALAREEAALRASIQRGHQEQTNVTLARSQRRVYTPTISQAQIHAWQDRLPKVQAEKREVFSQLRKAQN